MDLHSRFMGMGAYNPDLPPTLFQDGALTLQFGYDRRHISTLIESDERVGVVVLYQDKKIYLYTDEHSNLFGNKSSETCIGRLLTGNHTWNGMATIDLLSIRKYHHFSIV
jgi:hypothetical protein